MDKIENLNNLYYWNWIHKSFHKKKLKDEMDLS
jgi:hypothetical protein